MNRQKIKERLKEHLDHVIELGYEEKEILGIFAYGSMNYDLFNEEKSDIDSQVILLPTFSDFCLRKPLSKEIAIENNEKINLKDIRLYREILMKQSINLIETLYTPYYILNPTYGDLFKEYFIDNREDIAHMNRYRAIKSAAGQALTSLSHKDLYNGERLFYFLEKYMSGEPYEKCIQPEDPFRTYLLNIKYKDFEEYETEEEESQICDVLKQKVKEISSNIEDIESPSQASAREALDKGLVEILKRSFDLSEKDYISKGDFLNKLTHAEEKAYYSIVKEIKAEGSIIISKITEKNNLSRSVYNNLLAKMKENKIAEINNSGAKGTHIKITHPELLAEAKSF